jgi:dolichol-phosphate mannosyltransferase
MSVIVVIPTYNEADNLVPLCKALLSLALELEILIVDDASPDGTGELAQELADTEYKIRVIHRAEKLGLGTAYTHGLNWALENTNATLIAQMDADFSHDPTALPSLVEVATRNTIAVGSRYVMGGGIKNWGLGRRFLSKAANLYVKTILSLPIADVTGAFRCWPRCILSKIDLSSIQASGFAVLPEMLFRAKHQGFSITEVPIIFEERRVGQSKLTLGIAVESFCNVWYLRWRKLSRHTDLSL